MEITRKLRKVGGSVMVPLPPEVLQEAGLAVDSQVVIRSRPGHVDIEPERGPDAGAMEFLDSFLAEYGEAMAKLADR
jgi:antitoxin component of MazEF toxin-antitoxin module